MKPTGPAYTTEGNLTGQEIDLSVDQSNLVHLMGLLTAAYSDPALAVIREYATNAADSHVAAGNPGPIRVVLPTELNPQFVVQDFGVGLSVDDLRDTFSKYGASTKRETDEETGTLGIGCKSALAYTEQFVIEGTKGGVRATCVMTRNERGGSIKVVDTVSTDDPNGVTIKVPVNDVSGFRKKALDYFRFWRTPVEVVNETIELPEGVWIADDILVTQDLSNDIIVMGNVPYRNDGYAHRNLSRLLPYGWHVVVWAKMGDIDFPPSREELQYTAKTNKFINNISDSLPSLIEHRVQEDINNAKTKADAFKVALDYYGLTRNYEFKFNGEPVPTNFRIKGWRFRPAGRTKCETLTDYSFREINNDTLFIKGFDLASVSASHRKKIKKYGDDNDIDVSRTLIVNEPFWRGWFTPNEVVDWQDISKVSISTGKSGGSSGLIGVYDGDKWERVEYDDVDYKVIYWTPADIKNNAWDRNGIHVDDIYRNTRLPVVLLGKNRWDKFKRENPNAVEYKAFLIDKLTELDKQASLSDKVAYHYSHSLDIATLNPDKIDDPELKAAVQTARDAKTSTYREARLKLVRALRNIDDYSSEEVEKPESPMEQALDKYPYLAYNGNVDNSHTYDYVNGVYNAV